MPDGWEEGGKECKFTTIEQESFSLCISNLNDVIFGGSGKKIKLTKFCTKCDLLQNVSKGRTIFETECFVTYSWTFVF